jgi:cytochrome c biogenesis protein CcmG/thiol:disulfide interchange protein DsbE
MSNKPNSRPKQATANRVAEARGASGGSNGLLIGGAIAIVIVLALLVAIFVGRSGDSDVAADDVMATAEPVSVTGEALPVMPKDGGTDPAVGMTMPKLVGEDLQGQTLTIGPSGNPQMLVYLAHWCPHCQAEVPVLVDWMKDGGNGDVEVRGVATGNDPNRPNYPPTKWLAGEDWTVPTLIDPTGLAAEASGLSGFPYFIFLDDKGNVTSRASGELSIDQINEHLVRARAGSEGATGTVAPGGPSSPAEG